MWYIISADDVWAEGSWRPDHNKNLVVVVLNNSDPHENFTEINLI